MPQLAFQVRYALIQTLVLFYLYRTTMVQRRWFFLTILLVLLVEWFVQPLTSVWEDVTCMLQKRDRLILVGCSSLLPRYVTATLAVFFPPTTKPEVYKIIEVLGLCWYSTCVCMCMCVCAYMCVTNVLFEIRFFIQNLAIKMKVYKTICQISCNPSRLLK